MLVLKLRASKPSAKKFSQPEENNRSLMTTYQNTEEIVEDMQRPSRRLAQ